MNIEMEVTIETDTVKHVLTLEEAKELRDALIEALVKFD